MLWQLPFFLLPSFTTISTWELTSPVVTNWGTWRGWDYCPKGTAAAAIQVKAEDEQGKGDDTGVNAVALYCQPLYWKTQIKGPRIMSGEGPWGDWGNIKWCPPGQFLIGFQLRSERKQHEGDDAATSNFAGYCGPRGGGRDKDNWVAGDTMPWGDWTQIQWCPEGRVICAIQTQIEEKQGDGDDTAMNNVNVKCC